jgi:hypothetical protein
VVFVFDDFERTLAYSVASARVSRQPSLFFCFLIIPLPVILGPDLSTQHEMANGVLCILSSSGRFGSDEATYEGDE